MIIMDITKEQFESYVEVQKSGVTNMWAVDVVCELSGLRRDEVIYIMNNYAELQEKYEVQV